MFKSVEGVFRHGKVELAEVPDDVESARVIVTFIPAGSVDLRSRGIEEEQAASLRARLKAFEEDWEKPGMEGYDAL